MSQRSVKVGCGIELVTVAYIDRLFVSSDPHTYDNASYGWLLPGSNSENVMS